MSKIYSVCHLLFLYTSRETFSSIPIPDIFNYDPLPPVPMALDYNINSLFSYNSFNQDNDKRETFEETERVHWRYSPTPMISPSGSPSPNSTCTGSNCSKSKQVAALNGSKAEYSPAAALPRQTQGGEGIATHEEISGFNQDHDGSCSYRVIQSTSATDLLSSPLTPSPHHFRDSRPPKPQHDLLPGNYWVFLDAQNKWVQMSRWQLESPSQQGQPLIGVAAKLSDQYFQEGNNRGVQRGTLKVY